MTLKRLGTTVLNSLRKLIYIVPKIYFCRQIALKALSERLSKYQQDKQPLLQKPTRDLKPNAFSNSPSQPPASSHHTSSIPPTPVLDTEKNTEEIAVNVGASTSFAPTAPTIL